MMIDDRETTALSAWSRIGFHFRGKAHKETNNKMPTAML